MSDTQREDRWNDQASGASASESTGSPLLVALLPVRNAEADLPSYLEHVGTFCDAVVALDDGSTDGTHDILAAHPMVKVLLRNPRRKDYRGWDDAANRNRLIAASEELEPEWLISLDADERFDDVDAAALRSFIQTDALPGFAYGFRHVPMREDAEHFLPRFWWAYRLFSAAPGQRFPDSKLHFVPVPTSIPRHLWLKTTLRIKHFGELTAERRLTRFGKYLEADPSRRYEDFYAQCLAARPAEELGRWLPRPESVPVLLGGVTFDEVEELEQNLTPKVPEISVIVVDLDGNVPIERTITSVLRQDIPGELEVMVVTRIGSHTERTMRESFPTVKLIVLPRAAMPGEARNRGLVSARGRMVTFLTPESELPPGNLASRLSAHSRGYGLVTGTVINGTRTPAGWASYFLEHADALPGLPAAEVDAAVAHCSYARMPLIEVGGFPESVHTGEEGVTNQSIIRRGYVAYRDPAIQIIEHGPASITSLVGRQFDVGRSEGRMVLAHHRDRGQLLSRETILALAIGGVPMRLRRIEERVSRASADLRSAYHRRLIAVGTLTSLAGEWWEILRPGRGKGALLWGAPVQNILLSGQQRLALVQLDAITTETTVWPIPFDIEVAIGQDLVSLTSVLNSGGENHDERSLVSVRQLASQALDVEGLECIVDSRLKLPERPISVSSHMPSVLGWKGAAHQVVSVIRTMKATRRGRVRSTLSLWTTAKVLRRVGELASPPNSR